MTTEKEKTNCDPPYVLLMGRPNVGKSTLFNRFLGRREAIVDSQPGVTRDLNLHSYTWGGRSFRIADSGGLLLPEKDDMETVIARRLRKALEEKPDLVLLLVDGKAGLHPSDKILGQLLRSEEIPCLVVVNKIDNFKNSYLSSNFECLGLGHPLPVSAEHGIQVNKLLDIISERCPDVPYQSSFDEKNEDFTIACVGAPNAGKSTLINLLLNDQRAIVSDLAGTTRDTVSYEFKNKSGGVQFKLLDTAGLRKKRHLEDLEYYARLRTERAAKVSKLIILLIDINRGVTQLDRKLISWIGEEGKGLLVLFNKWDLVDAEDKTFDHLCAEVLERQNFSFPMLPFSAETGRGKKYLFQRIEDLKKRMALRISTSQLNRILEEWSFTSSHGPVRIQYGTQTETHPSRFLLFTSPPPHKIQSSIKRSIAKFLQEKLDLDGVNPLINLRGKNSKQGGKNTNFFSKGKK